MVLRIIKKSSGLFKRAYPFWALCVVALFSVFATIMFLYLGTDDPEHAPTKAWRLNRDLKAFRDSYAACRYQRQSAERRLEQLLPVEEKIAGLNREVFKLSHPERDPDLQKVKEEKEKLESIIEQLKLWLVQAQDLANIPTRDEREKSLFIIWDSDDEANYLEVKKYVRIPSNLPLMHRIRRYGDELTKSRFDGNQMKIISKKIQGKNILVVDLIDPEKTGTWWSNYFQGTTGGGITAATLWKGFLQFFETDMGFDGLEFHYNGEALEECEHACINNVRLLIKGKIKKPEKEGDPWWFLGEDHGFYSFNKLPDFLRVDGLSVLVSMWVSEKNLKKPVVPLEDHYHIVPTLIHPTDWEARRAILDRLRFF